MKDFLSLARERYSCRSFSSQEIEKEKLELILEAGRIAPSAKNKQPLRLVVINEQEALAKVKKSTSCTYNSSCIIAVCYQKEECWCRPFDGKLSGDIDATIATTHMMMEATELGISSVWVMWFDNDKLKEEFNVPSSLEVSALLVLGYPNKEASPSLNHSLRKSKEELVTYNSFTK
ncbi:MAG: nitroreductase family protein [Bacilli bacterium]